MYSTVPSGLLLTVICVLYCTVGIVVNCYIGRGRRGRDRMVVGFITMCAISAYHH